MKEVEIYCDVCRQHFTGIQLRGEEEMAVLRKLWGRYDVCSRRCAMELVSRDLNAEYNMPPGLPW